MDLNRRDFFKFSFGSILLISSPYSASASSSGELANINLADKTFKKLSYLAYKTTSTEGQWTLSNIEGTIPQDINGRFLKIGPGTKKLYGQSFNHFFDGDAYVIDFDVNNGSATLKTRFLNTPERAKEQQEHKMLYHEFGTRSPEKKSLGRKNQPNINLIAWNQSLLALSEGGHPVKVDSVNFNVLSSFDFNGTLPKKVSFTAHPKFDPITKEGYAFGLYQGLSKALKVYKMNPSTHDLTELYSINQKHVYMIHDMILTKNHIIFVIPPAYYGIKDIVLDKIPLSQTLKFDKSEPTRVLILSRDGNKKPIEFSLPASLVFHNGNAYEENGIMTFQSFMTEDKTLLDLINQWQSDADLAVEAPSMYEIKIDLIKNKMISKTRLLSSHDFPVFNEQYIGLNNQFLYCASMTNKNDPMAFDGLTKFNLISKTSFTYSMKDDEMCGEPFYVARENAIKEDEGYLCYIGYNQKKDQSFLEILDAKDLSFLARIWADRYLPLGFHGHFIDNKTIH